MHASGQSVQLIGGFNAIAHAQRDHFGGIGDGTTAQRQNQISLCQGRLLCRLHHRITWRVRRHGVKNADRAGTQDLQHLLHRIGLTTEGAAGEQVDTLRPHRVQLFCQGLRERRAVNDALGVGIAVNTRSQHGAPSFNKNRTKVAIIA